MKQFFEPIAASGAAASAGLGFLGGVNNVTIPLIGAPLVTICMACAGSLLSFSYGNVTEERWTMYRKAFTNSMVGVALTVLLPIILEWEWTAEHPQLQPALAFLISLGCRWMVPVAIELAPNAARSVLERIFSIKTDPPSGA